APRTRPNCRAGRSAGCSAPGTWRPHSCCTCGGTAPMADAASPDNSGRYAYDGLDGVLHEKSRLGILTALVARPGGIAFTELARLCSLTDGNLSRHLDRLAKAGLIEIRKGYDRRRPLTTCRITAVGRRRFREYLA